MHADPLTIDIDTGLHVSALAIAPADAFAACVLAHGAGAGMTHPFMVGIAEALAARGVATLRYQFPFMQRGSRRPDSPSVAHAAVRAAVAQAVRRWPGLPLFAGGKSFGARMTSQAQAGAPLTGVRGLVFLGFPLHPAGKPSDGRAAHLSDVHVPMLFVQGTRDELASLPLLERVLAPLAGSASLERIERADHAFEVPRKSGLDNEAVLAGMADTCAGWMLSVVRRPPG